LCGHGSKLYIAAVTEARSRLVTGGDGQPCRRRGGVGGVEDLGVGRPVQHQRSISLHQTTPTGLMARRCDGGSGRHQTTIERHRSRSSSSSSGGGGTARTDAAVF